MEEIIASMLKAGVSEAVVNEILDRVDERCKDPAIRALRGKELNLNAISDKMEWHDKMAKSATGDRKQFHLDAFNDLGRQHMAVNKDLRHHRGNILQGYRDNGATNPEAHKMLNDRMKDKK